MLSCLAKYSLFLNERNKLSVKPLLLVYCEFERVIRKSYSKETTRNLFALLKTMSKERISKKTPSRLHKIRQQAHQNVAEKNRPASEICLQVLGNGARGSARSLFVFTDQWRYMFNCGEGTQRLANEFKAKLSRLDHIFVTHRSWENIGGLPGLILTIQNMAVPKITLHGPNGIENLFDMTKGFMLTEDITIEKKSVESERYEDHILTVDYVPLYGSKSSCIQYKDLDNEDDQVKDYYQELRTKKASSENDSNQVPASKRQKVSSSTEDYDVSVAYICRPKHKPGQLMLDKCLEHGVPPGPLLGVLKGGQDVTLQDGKIVKSSDVVSPVEPSPVFIVLECPKIDFLDSLLENKALMAHQSDAASPDDLAAVVVHFTPSEVLRNSRYQQWMQRFHSSTQHLILNDENDGPSSFAIHRLQHKLNLLHPEIFPLLKDLKPVTNDRNLEVQSNNNEICSETMLKYMLRPFKRVDTSSQITLNPDEFLSECIKVPTFTKVHADLKTKLQNSVLTGEKYPEIVFLGTGSSIPSKVRNTSGILVNLSDSKSIVMDCGEGTFNQLHRFYGKADIDAVLRRIVAIYVSHLHADHHIGLIKLLKERRKAFEGHEFVPLTLLAPRQMLFWLTSYHNVFEPILDEFKLIGNGTLLSQLDKINDPNYVAILNDLELQKIDTVYVRHCPHAFGVAVTHKSGWKLVYSGDTMPSDSLVNIGTNCDVLIHEATMEDELQVEARKKRHSTTSEAIECGMKMNAKFILLTHFSQRYAKVPLYNENFHNDVGIAFDNMRVSFNQLRLLPHFMNTLKTMFVEELEDMQEKTAKKKRRENLENEMREKAIS